MNFKGQFQNQMGGKMPASIGVFYEQVTGVKVCFWFFLSRGFCFCSRWGRGTCCSPPGFYSHSL